MSLTRNRDQGVPTSFTELLTQHARGTLTLDELQARIDELAQQDASQLTEYMDLTRREAAAGRLPEAAARTVVALMEARSSATLQELPQGQIQKTLLRSPIAAPTLIAERQDHTDLLDADVTERNAPADTDATLRVNRGAPQTAARTLRASSKPPPATFAATRDAKDRTQIITDRLVKSLDDSGEMQHGRLQPGSIIKQRFVLERMIGKGGMGLVFAAIDRRKEEARDVNPLVALKVLNADFKSHPQSLIALQREARKAQTLAHPNVVTVFDFDRDGDTVYMTMELLKGRPLETLAREIRGKGVGRDVALPIIRGIAEGLAYAHRKGIVHSDLKPGNVFLCEDGTPKILDFGIARAVPSAVSEEAADIFDAGMLGAYTEAYATDEMVQGVDPHPADDMYALGLIGYELLTGFHPYQRNSAQTARKLGIKPPSLKGLKMREARALERCLSFDRKQRPQNAAEFLKLFRGVTKLQQATLAAAGVLALAAGYFSYENYRETSPAIPFSQLPLEQQQEFAAAMTKGNGEWEFYAREKNPVQLMAAVEHYAAAYATHPRNRDATKALKKVADEFLGSVGTDAESRRTAATFLREQSDFYRRYAPVVAASE